MRKHKASVQVIRVFLFTLAETTSLKIINVEQLVVEINFSSYVERS